MNIHGSHPFTSNLKPFFDDLINNYLEGYYLKIIKEINPVTDIEYRVWIFFVKTLNTLRSINLLFSSGNIVEARILMRSLFELTILTKKLIKDKEVFIKYSKAYEMFKRIETAIINIGLIENDQSITFFTKEELEQLIKDLENEISTLGFTPTNNKNSGKPHVNKYFEIFELAKDVGEEVQYKTTYKNLCLDTHTSSSHFYKYLVKDDIVENKFKLNMHPYLHEQDLMISLTVMFSYECIDHLTETFGIEKDVVANRQFHKLAKMSYLLLPQLIKQGTAKKHGIGLLI
ncbi:DUF5677 domain-containing protein [Fictibacillus barbaricus]|uniref:Uncharacterized protein n=1 Tax=Fictibacillus barbaricus TaxID=182136 RepID=A0ABS2ZIK8_9BACL|nr:DUF5677 domain-containing protein [Fictibacillus barbaricus]MBN3547983.1 hypothetical protein [Fictibacillus barbaricus]GGB53067.1 hypothetical protein GCM10007199_18680 [Fictibacillus barbaricus]